MTALADFMDDTTPYPDVVIETLKQRTRAALRELDLSKADMSDLALVITAQQQQLLDLRALAATLGAAIPAAESTHTALYDAIAALSARLAALEGRSLVGVTGQLTKTLTVGVGGTVTNYGITFTKPMPSADYLALVSLDNTSMSLLGNVAPVYPVLNKTAFGCTVPVRNTAALTLAQSVTVQVAALQLN